MARIYHDFAGYGTRVALVAFAVWMTERKGMTFPEDVIARFNVSRATANRWLNAYEEATRRSRPRRATNGEVKAAA